MPQPFGGEIQDFWELFQRPSATPTAKLDRMIRLAVDLGLRCPTEPTLKFMASMWMCACNDDAELARLSPEQKRVFLGFVRKAFHRARKTAPDPPVYLEGLPANPVEFCVAYPDVYRAVYGDTSKPELVGSDVLSRVAALDRTYGCRSHGASVGVAPAAPPTDVERMMQMFMAAQQAMFQSMAALQAPSAGERPAVSFAGMEVARPVRRLPTLEFVGTPSPARPGSDVLAMIPPAAPAPFPNQQVAPAAAGLQQPELDFAPAGPPPLVAPGAMDLLAMLDRQSMSARSFPGVQKAPAPLETQGPPA